MAYMTVCIIAALVALGQVVWESWASVVHRAGFDLCDKTGIFWNSVDDICEQVSINIALSNNGTSFFTCTFVINSLKKVSPHL